MDVNELRAEDKLKLSRTGKKYFNLIEFDNEERLICEIRKHPIGQFFIYLTGCVIAFAVSVVLGFVGFSGTLEDSGIASSSLGSVVTVIGFVFVLLIIGAMLIRQYYTQTMSFMLLLKKLPKFCILTYLIARYPS